MALTGERNTKQQDDKPIVDLIGLPVKGSVKIYKGAMVGRDAGGFLKPMSADLTLRAVGMALSTVDTTGAADGAFSINVRQGVFKFLNGDAIAVGAEGADLYASDDQTANKGDSSGTRPFCGKLVAIDSDGVWVEMRLTATPSAANAGGVFDHFTITFPAPDMTKIADGVIATFTPKVQCRIKAISWVQWTPVTTAAKLSNVHPEVAGVAATGGVVALTSAACTPIGVEIKGTAVVSDGKDIVPAGVAFTLKAANTTAFIEGSGAFVVEFG